MDPPRTCAAKASNRAPYLWLCPRQQIAEPSQARCGQPPAVPPTTDHSVCVGWKCWLHVGPSRLGIRRSARKVTFHCTPREGRSRSVGVEPAGVGGGIPGEDLAVSAEGGPCIPARMLGVGERRFA